jgi:hypothetical protein
VPYYGAYDDGCLPDYYRPRWRYDCD